MWEYILGLVVSLSTADNYAFVQAADAVVASEPPIFDGPDGRQRSAALLVAVAWYESKFQLDAVGDGGRSVCAMQIFYGKRALLRDADACLRTGYRMLRASARACPSHPVAVYARGSCASAEGRRLSNHRMQLAKKLLESRKEETP